MNEKIKQKIENFLKNSTSLEITKVIKETVDTAKELYKSKYPSFLYKEETHIILKIEKYQELIAVTTCPYKNKAICIDEKAEHLCKKDDEFIKELLIQLCYKIVIKQRETSLDKR